MKLNTRTGGLREIRIVVTPRYKGDGIYKGLIDQRAKISTVGRIFLFLKDRSSLICVLFIGKSICRRDMWGKSGKIDLIVPYSQLSGSAKAAGQTHTRRVSGLNDPWLRFSVNFYGAPALTMQEFAEYRQALIIGANVQVSAPIGQYDSDKLVNLGNNRWFVKPDIGISKAW